MDTTTIIRAWKDPAFRASLSSEQRAALPESPSGQPMTEISEGELGDVVGGGLPGGTIRLTVTRPSLVDGCPSALWCPDFTWRQTTVINPTVINPQLGTSVVVRQF